jgi:hypothetical protein
LENLFVHLKICGSQANLQQFHDGFDLQDSPSRQCIIVVELICGDLQSFVDWNISENAKKIINSEGI